MNQTNNNFKVSTPNWLWFVIASGWVLCWVAAYFSLIEPEPLIKNGTGVSSIDQLITVVIYAVLIGLWPLASIRMATTAQIKGNEIHISKQYSKSIKTYEIQDITKVNLCGMKYKKGVLSVKFKCGSKSTFESTQINFNKFVEWLKLNNKV